MSNRSGFGALEITHTQSGNSVTVVMFHDNDEEGKMRKGWSACGTTGSLSVDGGYFFFDRNTPSGMALLFFAADDTPVMAALLSSDTMVGGKTTGNGTLFDGGANQIPAGAITWDYVWISGEGGSVHWIESGPED